MTSRRTPPVEIGPFPEGAALMTSLAMEDAETAFALSDGSQIRLPRHFPRQAFGSRPDERPVLAEMVRLRLAGLGYDRIAFSLNDRGIPTREGRRWHGKTVRATLRRIDPRLCPRRGEAPGVPQPEAARHYRDLDRQRKRRAALRSEGTAA
jgi:hypothetical protein